MVPHETTSSAESPRIEGLSVHEEALPGSLFERLARAMRATGDDRIKRNYTTTFWFPLDKEPENVAEEAVLQLLQLARPGSECVGIEWWLGRLRHGEKLRLHFDRDMMVRKKTGRFVHPVRASVLYMNSYPSSPTVLLDQVPSPDGRSRIPAKAETRESVAAVANRYLVFPGNLRHGVIPLKENSGQESSATNGGQEPELRLTFLVNYWDRRPLPPLCSEYDGTVYPSLEDRGARG